MEVQAVVNKDLSKRTRALEPMLSAGQVLEKDLKIALEVAKFQDARQGLWQVETTNRPQENTENSENVPPQEAGKEDEDTEKQPDKLPKTVMTTENPILMEAQKTDTNDNSQEQRQEALDRVLLYLRIVHSIDFYSQKDYRGEDDMP